MGGDREVALAAFIVARLVVGVLPPNSLAVPARLARAAAARHWLASLALSTAVRAPFARTIDATGGTDAAALAAAVRAAIDAAAPALDGASRHELEALLQGL